MEDENNEAESVEAETLTQKALDIETAFASRATAEALRSSSRRLFGLFLQIEEEMKAVTQLFIEAADAIDPPTNENTNEGDTNVN